MENPWRRRVRQSLRIDLCVHFIPVDGSPAVTSCNRFSKAWMTAGSFFFDRLTATTRLAYSVGGILKGLFQVCKTTANRVWAHAGNLSYVFDGSSTRLACQVGNEQASPFFVKGCDHPIDGSMLFSSGTLGRFSTILTGTLANPSMYCSGHNNLPPLRLPRQGKLIIPETFKLFPDSSLRPASWLALLSRTFTFELAPTRSPSISVEYDYVDKQSIPTAGLSPASPTALWAAGHRISPPPLQKCETKTEWSTFWGPLQVPVRLKERLGGSQPESAPILATVQTTQAKNE